MDYMILILPLVFIYGILVGSFLNVCIYRIPKHESIVTTPSHCMSCGYGLKWYDLVPVFSWLCLRGKCRKCKAPISAQYPIIEALNGVLWVVVIVVCGLTVEGVLYCLFTSALIVLSVIDFRTYEIPFGINVLIAILGAIRLVTDLSGWFLYVLGAVLVSGIFYIAYLVTKGRGMGGGDIKLMAAAGLLLGAPKVFLAMIVGCALAVVIHSVRMKVSGAEHKLAFGPYLAVGLFLSAIAGEPVITWYFSLF